MQRLHLCHPTLTPSAHDSFPATSTSTSHILYTTVFSCTRVQLPIPLLLTLPLSWNHLSIPQTLLKMSHSIRYLVHAVFFSSLSHLLAYVALGFTSHLPLVRSFGGLVQ
ncbi:hypothetical protein PAXRUDRAFT_668029 [Paxillus rubicundulus Ve08.2h10]|uniref:Uncharacterized protein n=1 Tax=Paxillus rubicundulus Ve08.2h10 TaxID=930991 RepID=A0A0D0E364_9AGAM|nr:hypothetical protein PAXRUDRAFT_668029 [Paxillus rubicundulus Ve08.2h10]